MVLARLDTRVNIAGMKGKISRNLENILRDEQGRRLLRQSLLSGKDGDITVGAVKYRVSTRNVQKSLTGRFVAPKRTVSSR
jgi:hypothetical protein